MSFIDPNASVQAPPAHGATLPAGRSGNPPPASLPDRPYQDVYVPGSKLLPLGRLPTSILIVANHRPGLPGVPYSPGIKGDIERALEREVSVSCTSFGSNTPKVEAAHLQRDGTYLFNGTVFSGGGFIAGRRVAIYGTYDPAARQANYQEVASDKGVVIGK